MSDILRCQIVKCCRPIARIGVNCRTWMRIRESGGCDSVKTRTVNMDVVKHDVLKTAAITKLNGTALGVQDIDVGKRDIADRII